NFHLSLADADLLWPQKLHHRLGPEDEPGPLDQVQGRGVGAAGVRPYPVAGPKHQPGPHWSPALVHDRLDAPDALHVRHLADPAVFGEGLGYDELFRADRLVIGEHLQLPGCLNLAGLFTSSLQGAEPAAGRVYGRIEPDLPLGREKLNVVDQSINLAVRGALD